MENEERKIEFNWGPGIFIIVYHIFLLVALPFYFYYASLKLSMFVAAFILLYLTGLSITAGYHRYFAHRTFRTNTFMEYILVFFGSMAGQGSVLRWSYDHRLHHAYVDTDNDPYSINKGFWYAHMWWIFEKPRKIDPKTVPDLLKNNLLVVQHKYYPLFMVFTNFLAYAFVGWLLDDYLGAFFIAVWLRFFILHHFTWFINSLAHTWGDKPFSEEHSAVNNYVISLLTFGEGYHNYHHTFANDYRNGIKWYHFDPTKWLLWTLSKVGLVDNLKQVDPYTIQKRMVLERKNLLTEQIKQLWFEKKDELEKEVQEISERIVAKISAFCQLRDKYSLFIQESREKEILDSLRTEIKFLKKSLRNDWRYWTKLSRNIMRHTRPISH